MSEVWHRCCRCRRLAVLVLLLVLCGQSGRSAAQSAGSKPVANKPAAKPHRPTLQKLLQLPHWAQLQLAISADPLFNPVGGLQSTGTWVQQGSIDLQLSSGLAKPSSQWKEGDHWGLNLNVSHVAGNDALNTEIGALFPLQVVADPPGFWLGEATVERKAAGSGLGVKGGILSLDPDFAAVPIASLYVHASLNNTLNISNNDLPINPYTAVGGVVTLEPSKVLQLRLGLYSLASVVPVSGWLGAQPSLASQGSGTAQIVQLNYTGSSLAPAADQPLTACGPSWALVRDRPRCPKHTTIHNQLPGGLISVGAFNTADPQSGDGIYGSITVRSGLPLGLDDRVWIGASYSPNRAVDFAPTFVAGGLVVQGLVPGRAEDVVLLGLGRGGLSAEAAPYPTSSYEGMVELGYRVALNQTVQLQPTLQWIINPSGANQPVPGILALGMRIDVNF